MERKFGFKSERKIIENRCQTKNCSLPQTSQRKEETVDNNRFTKLPRGPFRTLLTLSQQLNISLSSAKHFLQKLRELNDEYLFKIFNEVNNQLLLLAALERFFTMPKMRDVLVNSSLTEFHNIFVESHPENSKLRRTLYSRFFHAFGFCYRDIRYIPKIPQCPSTFHIQDFLQDYCYILLDVENLRVFFLDESALCSNN